MSRQVIKPALSLKQFILKQEVKNLYRKLMRTVKDVPDATQREELKTWIRTDFRNNIHQTDEMAIKMLIKYGERSLNELRTTLNLAK